MKWVRIDLMIDDKDRKITFIYGGQVIEGKASNLPYAETTRIKTEYIIDAFKEMMEASLAEKKKELDKKREREENLDKEGEEER